MPFIVMTDNEELAKESVRLGAYQSILTPIKNKDQVKSKIDDAIKNTELLHQLALNYMEYVPGGVILLEAVSEDILYVNGRALEIFDCDNVDDFRSLAGNKFEGLFFQKIMLPLVKLLKLCSGVGVLCLHKRHTESGPRRDLSNVFTMWVVILGIHRMDAFCRCLSLKTIWL